MDIPSRLFAIDPAKFFPRDPRVPQIERHRRGLMELVGRYRLANTPVLSVGAGAGFSEYWLHKAGCNLLLADDDVDGSLSRRLRILGVPVDDIADDGRIYYLVGLKGLLRIDRRFKTCMMRRTAADLALLTPSAAQKHDDAPPDVLFTSAQIVSRGWPETKNPFLPSHIEMAAQLIDPGGLLLFVSQLDGPAVTESESYLRAAIRQFAENGLSLREVYYPAHQPTRQLMIAIREGGGNSRVATNRSNALADLALLTTLGGPLRQIDSRRLAS